jgi:dinuclear metal center YbgI/SA1388 family protein
MQTPKIQDVTAFLESWAPRAYQESYDNSGLLVGNPEKEVTAALITLDCTEPVIDEAVRRGCNLIISHHPILFKGLKSLTGKTYVERTVLKAIQKDIALYAIHTNLDNVRSGVNARIANRLGLTETRVLRPRRGTLSKLVTFAPADAAEKVLTALHAAGAGKIGQYSHCSFEVRGTGRFQPDKDANPNIGTPGVPEKVEEIRLEVLLQDVHEKAVLAALRHAHPYEEVAYFLTPLSNENQDIGSGLVGTLPRAMAPQEFLKFLKETMHVGTIRHTLPTAAKIQRVAVCGGAGSFLLVDAIQQGAEVFVSADFKYHEFFDAEGRIMVCDIGHYESEQFTKALLQEVLSKNFTTFASHFSETVTNPISYF